MTDCIICDLYAVIDQHLAINQDGCNDFAVDLVTVLPPRGHAFHSLTAYRSRTKASAP